MDPSTLDLVRRYASKIVVPTAFSAVFNDQCMLSFDTPYSSGGLYVNMVNHQGFGEDYLALDHERTGCHLYLHEKWQKVRKEKKKEAGEVTKMAIGVEGGFDPDNSFDIVKQHSVCVMPDRIMVPFPCLELPDMVTQVSNAIIAHEGSAKKAQAAWEEDAYQDSVFAKELVQLECTKKISPDPSTWIDMATGEQSDNLWLNLSDGYIGGGRRQMNADGTWTGSGSALAHFEETGRQYPLAVKLGTISARGADVYSYPEDSMVLDPKLGEHLAHWGINMMQMEKTGKSMAEMNIDLNLKWEYNRILEGDKELVPVTGAGYIGIENLGNSCYMNSVVQCLLSLPELQTRYVDVAEKLFKSAGPELQSDFPVQMAKLGKALNSDTYSEPMGLKEEDPNAVHVEPYMFKNLVGKGSAEFSSDRQQDAAEYLQYLLEYISRSERQHNARLGGIVKTADLFTFETEIRTECRTSGKVRYSTAKHSMLDLPVPLELATNKSEFEEYRAKRQKVETEEEKKTETSPVMANVPFSMCFQKFAAEETISDWYSSATQAKGEAIKTVRIKTFPKYLVVQMRKFYVDTDWTPKKMEVEIPDVPDDLSLEWLRGTGQKPEEELLPEEGSKPGGAAEADPAVVAMVVSMGFSENAAKRAALATGNSNGEEAVNWVLSHMEDADLNDPLPAPAGAAASKELDPNHIAMLTEMGFAPEQAKIALKACDMNVERTVEWLFSHSDDLDAACAQAAGQVEAEEGDVGGAANHRGEYSLLGFITHLGKNTGCGHYVAHLKKDDQWVLFNDRKVGVAQSPPRGMAYLYLFGRK